MAKEKKKPAPKPRAGKYEEKVKFEGTLEQMINMAVNTKAPSKKEEK
jgi:hypothetical protein